MLDKDGSLSFILEDGEEVKLFIIEQTTINGVNYLLVTDSDGEEESDAFILKEEVVEGEEVVFQAVEDDTELEAISKVFMELLDDYDIEYES